MAKGGCLPLKYVVGQIPKSVLVTFTLLGITTGESLVVFIDGVLKREVLSFGVFSLLTVSIYTMF